MTISPNPHEGEALQNAYREIQFLHEQLAISGQRVSELFAENERLWKENQALRQLADMYPGETLKSRE